LDFSLYIANKSCDFLPHFRHRKVHVAWPGSWPWRRGHINNNCGKVLHDDLACPNMASATWLHALIIN
jgi:hypothetical protein